VQPLLHMDVDFGDALGKTHVVAQTRGGLGGIFAITKGRGDPSLD
jgi:hypothetical protein